MQQLALTTNDDVALRGRAVTLLSEFMKCGGVGHENGHNADGRDIEEAIYRLSQESENVDYGGKVKQVAWNLKLNGRALLRQYTPSALVLLSDSELAKGTPIEEWHNALNAKIKKQTQVCTHLIYVFTNPFIN